MLVKLDDGLVKMRGGIDGEVVILQLSRAVDEAGGILCELELGKVQIGGDGWLLQCSAAVSLEVEDAAEWVFGRLEAMEARQIKVGAEDSEAELPGAEVELARAANLASLLLIKEICGVHLSMARATMSRGASSARAS